MPDEPSHFDDPELKAALMRLRGGHTASEELRRKVEQSLGAGGPVQIVTNPWTVSRLVPWAVAAAVVLAVIGGLYNRQQRQTHEEQEQAEYLADNRTLFTAMVVGFQSVPAESDKIATPQPNPADIQTRMAARVGHPVPMPDLTNSGWRLTQTSVVALDKVTAARFDFEQGAQRVVLVSLPASALKEAEDNEDYEFLVDHHPIAGYVSRDTLNCLVAGPAVPLDQVVALRDKLRGL